MIRTKLIRAMMMTTMVRTAILTLSRFPDEAAKLIENWLVRENADKGWFEGGGGPSEEAQAAAEAIAQEEADASELVEKAKAEAEAAPES